MTPNKNRIAGWRNFETLHLMVLAALLLMIVFFYLLSLFYTPSAR